MSGRLARRNPARATRTRDRRRRPRDPYRAAVPRRTARARRLHRLLVARAFGLPTASCSSWDDPAPGWVLEVLLSAWLERLDALNPKYARVCRDEWNRIQHAYGYAEWLSDPRLGVLDLNRWIGRVTQQLAEHTRLLKQRGPLAVNKIINTDGRARAARYKTPGGWTGDPLVAPDGNGLDLFYELNAPRRRPGRPEKIELFSDRYGRHPETRENITSLHLP
jgi:hypothetical protein